MGSQHSKRKRSGGGSAGSSGGGRGAGGGAGDGSGNRRSNSVSEGVKDVKELMRNKEFKFAANVAVSTALKVTGTDTLAAAAIAGAKGYQEYRRHGLEAGIRKGTVEFAKGQVTGLVAGAIASNAVGSAAQSLKISKVGKGIATAAVSSALEQLM